MAPPTVEQKLKCSLVRVPLSGWDTSAKAACLDLGRVSNVAAAVSEPMSHIPFLNNSLSGNNENQMEGNNVGASNKGSVSDVVLSAIMMSGTMRRPRVVYMTPGEVERLRERLVTIETANGPVRVLSGGWTGPSRGIHDNLDEQLRRHRQRNAELRQLVQQREKLCK